MTADFFIYAIGGGAGHARRGLLIQKALAAIGATSVVVVREGVPRSRAPIGESLLVDPGMQALSDAARRCRSIIVDTFERGWRGELSASLLNRFRFRALIARYRQRADLSSISVFERVLIPYPEKRSEWDGASCLHGRHVGYIINGSHLRHEPEAGTLEVIDPGGRCNDRALHVLRELCRKHGFALRLSHELGPALRGERLLVIGAGYHTFYELIAKGVDVRFLPLRKKHDDQFKRTALFALGAGTPAEIDEWLGSTLKPVAVDTAMDEEILARECMALGA